MFLKSKRIVSALIIFVMMFTYSSQTLSAIATTDSFSAITSGFFNQSDVIFNSYFVKSGSKTTGKEIDVNEKASIMFEISPNNVGEGFIKDATIKASETVKNFKFVKVGDIQVLEDETDGENLEAIEREDDENEYIEETDIDEETENGEETNLEEEIKDDEEINSEDEIEITEEMNQKEDIENKKTEKKEDEVNTEDDVKIENTQETNKEKEEVEKVVVSRSSNTREQETNEDELVNEDEVINEILTEEESEDNTLDKYQVDLISDREIRVQNIIHKTIIEVEIEYVKNEILKIDDFYNEVNFNLEGKYININLEEKAISANSNITIGWKDNKDIELKSEYTKLSPYKIGDKQGSILEQKIVITRETDKDNYLPLKNVSIEVNVPELNGEKPENVSVIANKLMATKGQDVGEVDFTNDNWKYNNEEKTLKIDITNEGPEVKSTLGTDEFVIVYKYSNYIDEGKYAIAKEIVVNVEEYSSNKNNISNKAINDKQEVEAIIGDMISYSLTTNEEAISKGKINANYNQEEPKYETEFNSTVNLSILTNDIFEELKISSNNEKYVDAIGNEFEANDVYYKKVKFIYNEIINAVSNGGSIEITNQNDELLYSLDANNVKTQDDCEINIDGKPSAINVVLKNISVNQNLNIEYFKAIGKSNYDKSIFNTFRELQSSVNGTIKYLDDEQVYNLSEITVNKTLKNSYTKANLSINNNSLNTMNENENIEFKIGLNNDNVDSDLYVNPCFEIVFPKYVKNVDVKNINLTYAEGLEIAKSEVYTENGIVKLRIELNGNQQEFSASTLTDGTNIIVTTSIKLDEETPAKKEEIKLYYYNEGVTNYETQTKWSINKALPQGILRETNGFGIAVVNYSAPTGLVLSNSIINYDGNLSTVKSVNQGEKIGKIENDALEKITTMRIICCE